MKFIDKELELYYNLTIDIFEYLNGIVNKINNKCDLIIECSDISSYDKWGQITFPNSIKIFLKSIMNTWEDVFYDSFNINKRDFMCTFICWVLTHELLHADQFILMYMYNNNEEYNKQVEREIELETYNFIKDNCHILESRYKFNILIDYFKDQSIINDFNNIHYNHITVKEFYLLTILNCILKDEEYHNKYIVPVFNDNSIQNIFITFDDNYFVPIKLDGMWFENTQPFSKMVYDETGKYGSYDIVIYKEFSITPENESILKIRFDVQNKLITDYMVFLDKDKG